MTLPYSDADHFDRLNDARAEIASLTGDRPSMRQMVEASLLCTHKPDVYARRHMFAPGEPTPPHPSLPAASSGPERPCPRTSSLRGMRPLGSTTSTRSTR